MGRGWIDEAAEVTPDLEQDFSGFADTAALLAWSGWISGEALNTDDITLDTGQGYADSDRSMRYDYPNPAGTDHRIRPGFLQLESGRTHVWVEVVFRFATTFDVSFTTPPPAAEIKLLTAGDYGGTGRWNIPQMQDGKFVVGWPDNTVNADAFTPSTLWDGNAHVFRAEMKLSSTPGSSSDGLLRFWVNGTKLYDNAAITTDATHTEIDYVGNENMNQAVDQNDVKYWTHRYRVWYSDPGWS